VPNGLTQIQFVAGNSLNLGVVEANVEVTCPEHFLSDTASASYVATERFEPNDAACDPQVQELANGFVHRSHISTPTDVDLWSVQLDRGERLSVHLGGIEPGTDFDLVVYGPEGTDINGFWTPSADDDVTSKQENDDIPLLAD